MVRSVILKISQIESEKDFTDFIEDFGDAFKERFGQDLEISFQNRKAIFSLHLEDLGEIRIDFMDKKKEKLIKSNTWGYYLPAGWICYNINWK